MGALPMHGKWGLLISRKERSLRPALLVLDKQLFDRDAHRLGEPAQRGEMRIGRLHELAGGSHPCYSYYYPSFFSLLLKIFIRPTLRGLACGGSARGLFYSDPVGGGGGE